MVGSNDSDLDEFAEDLYKDEDTGVNGMELYIDQVHQDTGHEFQEQRPATETRPEIALVESQITCTNQWYGARVGGSKNS